MAWKKQIGMPKIERKHHVIDVEGKVVGRVATQIAKLLQGKHKATYVPHIDAGDFVEVLNAGKIVFTGKKWEQKKHFLSSNRPGGIKAVGMDALRTTKPAKILEHAVRYMLPKNKQHTIRMKRLKISA
ncbi:MAG: 50S ribosomal protein L13 [Candidatus Uhrbacteria bacterium]|nr:50S ribosomal protein L13 [Candidatus Uhrbacteria bacterium]